MVVCYLLRVGYRCLEGVTECEVTLNAYGDQLWVFLARFFVALRLGGWCGDVCCRGAVCVLRTLGLRLERT